MKYGESDKFCVDCKHFIDYKIHNGKKSEAWQCLRTCHPVQGNFVDCDYARSEHCKCGVEGSLWEAKG
jgi:hypothetical protein